MDVRDVEATEIGQLAQLWYDGWHDALAPVLPADLARYRTLSSFEDRLRAAFPHVRGVGSRMEPVGFYIVNGDELCQIYVSAQARGSGVAAALIADAEARLSEHGVTIAWLACAIGNERAATFYEKCGWHRTGTMSNHVETPNGVLPLEAWRYEKHLPNRRMEGS